MKQKSKSSKKDLAPGATIPADCEECKKAPLAGCIGAPVIQGHKMHCRCSRCKAQRHGPVDELVKGIWLIPSTMHGRLIARAERLQVSQASIVRQALSELFAREA